MKKFSILFVWGLLALSFTGFSQIKVNSTGKVGINNASPSYQLDVNGTFRLSESGYVLTFETGKFYPYSGNQSLGSSSKMWNSLYVRNAYLLNPPILLSDSDAKTDIRNIVETSKKLMLLRPVVYKMKEEFRSNEQTTKGNDELYDQFGFLAQEIREIFPELVKENDMGVLGVQYSGLIPILVKAFQDQQAEITVLKERIAKLEQETR